MKMILTQGEKRAIWEDGKITGDEPLRTRVEALINSYEGRSIGEPFLGYADHGHMKQPLSVYLIVRKELPDIEISGDKIPVEPPEEGRIY